MLIFINIFLFCVAAGTLIVSVIFAFKVKQRSLKIELLEKKIAEQQNQIANENKNTQEWRNRLKKQQEALNKKWHQIQKDGKTLEEIAIKLEEDKRLLEIEKSNLNFQKNEIEQERQKIEKITNNFKNKWEQERTAIELEKNRIAKIIRQLKSQDGYFETENNRIKIEKQKIENEKKQLVKALKQIDKKKLEFEDFQKSLLENEKLIQLEIKKLKSEREEIENEKEDVSTQREKLNKQKEQLLSQQKVLNEELENIEKQNNEILKEKNELDQRKQKLEKWEKDLKEKKDQLKREKEEFEKLKLTAVSTNTDEIDGKNVTTPQEPEAPISINQGDGAQNGDFRNKFKKLIPELICFKKGQVWNLGIRFLGDLSCFSHIQIIQDDKTIQVENDEYYKIEKFAPITIKWKDKGKLRQKLFELNDRVCDNPLIFKVYSQKKNVAKFVKELAYGSYCVAVPVNWQREVELAGDAPIEPENLSIPGFKVHFFVLNKWSGFLIAFKKPDNEKYIISPKDSRFDLRGNIISDCQEDVAPLFGDELPKLYDNLSWKDVETIIVGEEGEGEGYDELGWEIQPKLDAPELDFNQLEQQGKIGIISKSKKSWFYIRIYDCEYNLIESLDFRFIQGLKGIKINNHSITPGANGHLPAKIKFFHNELCQIDIFKDGNKKISRRSLDNGTEATIPPNPAWDLTDWEIEDTTGKKVSIELLVERIWWSLYNENKPLSSNNWSDKVINLSNDRFNATSPYAISLWFPKPGWLTHMSVGFKKQTAQRYRLFTSQRNILIYLRDFGECEEVSNLINYSKFYLWLEVDHAEVELALINLIANKKPNGPINNGKKEIDIEKDPCCNNCDHARYRLGSTWCRRGNWPQQNSFENFKENIAHYKCGEWRGELDSENQA